MTRLCAVGAPFSHEYLGLVVGESAGHVWVLRRMLLDNWRLEGYAVGHQPLDLPVYGWCFDGEMRAVVAVSAFDPEVHNEPVLWHKRARAMRTDAPRRAELAEYNRVRCVHGSYPDDGQCARDVHCRVAWWSRDEQLAYYESKERGGCER